MDGTSQGSSTQPLRIFIGYDERQPVSYNVLQHSIVARASRPVAISPLVLSALPITRSGLTPFTFSRFLVPWLCGYQGWALFLDLDMLVLGDIAEIFNYCDEKKAVIVCKEQQRFEWASAMIFNCGHPANAVLTPDYVEDAKRSVRPHSIDWIEDETLIGAFPAEWNHCVGYNAPRPDAKLAHYTMGIPAFPEIKGCEFSDEWWAEFRHSSATQPWMTLMGKSVHVVRMPDGRVVPKLSEEGKAEMARQQRAKAAS